MKAICIRKKTKTTKNKRIHPADQIHYKNSRWECVTVNTNSTENPMLVIRKKMTRIVVIAEILGHRNGIVYIAFTEVSPEGIVKWTERADDCEIRISSGHFSVSEESEETVYAPIQVGDKFRHNYRNYTVKFIADDGSLIAWDEERQKSIFVNRNDRDQLKAYGMQLS